MPKVVPPPDLPDGLPEMVQQRAALIALLGSDEWRAHVEANADSISAAKVGHLHRDVLGH